MRVKKSSQAKTSSRVKKSSRAKTSARVKKFGQTQMKTLSRIKLTPDGRWLAAAAIIVIGVGVLIGASRESPPTSEAAADARAASRAIPIDESTQPIATAETTAETTDSIVSPEQAAVTITGCLEQDQDTFRLKDTSGDAPTARSWKSGFLKRSSASVSIVDAGRRFKLPSHVGERVMVRGTLIDREMHVRSLQRVSESCKGAPKA